MMINDADSDVSDSAELMASESRSAMVEAQALADGIGTGFDF